VEIPLDAVQPTEAETGSILGCLLEKFSLLFHSDVIVLWNVERIMMNAKVFEL